MLARGLKGVRLVTGDRCAGLVAAVGELLPGARCRRCMVHFERNILARVNPGNRDWTVDVLKAVFSMEPRDKALEKAESVAEEMEARKPKEAEFCLREGIGEVVCARIRYVTSSEWSTRRYLDMSRLGENLPAAN